MHEILKQVETIAIQCAKKLNMEIISVEYVKESGINILRIIASKAPVFTVNDSSKLNRLISEELDKVDLIDEEYYLEVSSQGLEKELKTDFDIKSAIGEYICIEVSEKIEGKNELYGDLISYEDDIFVIYFNLKGQFKKLAIEKSKVIKIRLAVKF